MVCVAGLSLAMDNGVDRLSWVKPNLSPANKKGPG